MRTAPVKLSLVYSRSVIPSSRDCAQHAYKIDDNRNIVLQLIHGIPEQSTTPRSRFVKKQSTAAELDRISSASLRPPLCLLSNHCNLLPNVYRTYPLLASNRFSIRSRFCYRRIPFDSDSIDRSREPAKDRIERTIYFPVTLSKRG